MMRAALLLIVVGACAGGAGVGAPCHRDNDCASGRCYLSTDLEHPYCAEACDDDPSCPGGGVCSTDRGDLAPGVRKACAIHCATDSVGEYVCVLGKPAPCKSSLDLDCGICGCPDGSVCRVETRACGPALEVGRACRANTDCASLNCGPLPGQGHLDAHCFVPAGSACTKDDCGSCDLVGGTPQCAQTCADNIYEKCQDPSTRCYGNDQTGYYCRSACDQGLCPAGFACKDVNDPALPGVKLCVPM